MCKRLWKVHQLCLNVSDSGMSWLCHQQDISWNTSYISKTSVGSFDKVMIVVYALFLSIFCVPYLFLIPSILHHLLGPVPS